MKKEPKNFCQLRATSVSPVWEGRRTQWGKVICFIFSKNKESFSSNFDEGWHQTNEADRHGRSGFAPVMESAVRAAILDACLSLNRSGLNQGMAGNISVRVGDEMLITPTATPYEGMRPEDIARLPLAGSAADAIGPLRPSSEWRFHRDLLRARPEFGAVVHAHAAHCTALSIARRGIPPCHYMILSFGGEDVRCARYETFGTAALSDAVLAAMQDRSACLMANHGMVSAGLDLAQAMWRATELEALARQYLLAMAAGGASLLHPAELASARERFASYRPD